MLRRTLPTLMAAALWTTALMPAPAQAKPNKSQTARGASAPAMPTLESEVVGSVNGKPIMTFGQLLNRLQQQNPPEFANAVSQAVGHDAVVAFFGSKPQSQLVVTRASVLKALRRNPPQALVSMLGVELSQEAVRQAAVKQKAGATEAETDAFITYLIRQQRKTMGAQIPPSVKTDDEFLAFVRPGLTRAKVKSQVRPNLAVYNMAKLDIQKKLGHPIADGDFIQARHILIKADPLPPSPTPEQKKADADALAKITKLRDDIVSGKVKFEDAAKDSSDDPGSKENGGSLGTFLPDGTMVKEFQDKALTTKVGDVSEPFRTQFGYHILQVTKTGKEMTPEERQDNLYEQEQRQARVTGAQLVQQARIENKLTPPAPNFPFPQGGGAPPQPRQ